MEEGDTNVHDAGIYRVSRHERERTRLLSSGTGSLDGAAPHTHSGQMAMALLALGTAALEAAERLLREQDARPALKQLVAPAEAAPSFSFSFG